MLTTDTKSQDLHQIAGVQDLSHENAAAVSGGVALLANGFNGREDRLTLRSGTTGNLGRFNNSTSSIRITRGQVWRFYTGKNRTGRGVNLEGTGSFVNLVGRRLRTFQNNIESAERLQ